MKQKYKRWLERAFVRVGVPLYMRVNNFFALITIVSVFFIVLETVESLRFLDPVFLAIEWVTVVLFTAEYIGRLIAEKRKIRYVFSFYGIVDLVSILPTYLGLANFSFLKMARITRILRFLRMVRLVKVMRMHGKGRGKKQASRDVQNLSIKIYILTLGMAVLLFGTLIYFFEGDNPVFANIPLGMLWAMKVTMGGVSQAMPGTVWGDIVSVLARFVGLVLFGLLIHIVGTFIEKLLLGKTGNR